MADKAGKQRRIRCGHCDELLSHRVYQRHRKDYYNAVERRWNRRVIDSSSEGSDIELDCTETDMFEVEPDTEFIDEEGKNIGFWAEHRSSCTVDTVYTESIIHGFLLIMDFFTIMYYQKLKQHQKNPMMSLNTGMFKRSYCRI